jgi:hypothetical protein
MQHMCKGMSMLLTLTIACFVAAGCPNHHLERDFFDKPPGDRVERLRQYMLADQYKIFRYGNDEIEPPDMELAEPIAERGAEAVPFLMDQLNANVDGIAVRDILLVFETMAYSGRYNVKANSGLMKVLTSKVSGMRDHGWQNFCLKMLQTINDSR